MHLAPPFRMLPFLSISEAIRHDGAPVTVCSVAIADHCARFASLRAVRVAIAGAPSIAASPPPVPPLIADAPATGSPRAQRWFCGLAVT